MFGIRPWEWERLTAAEAMRLMAYIDQQQRQGDDSGDL